MREQVVDHRVHRRACGYEQHDGARATEQSDELCNVCGAASIALPGFLAQGRDRGWVLVKTRHGDAVVRKVEHKIAPHDPQTDHADFILLLRMLTCHGFAFRGIKIATGHDRFSKGAAPSWCGFTRAAGLRVPCDVEPLCPMVRQKARCSPVPWDQTHR